MLKNIPKLGGKIPHYYVVNKEKGQGSSTTLAIKVFEIGRGQSYALYALIK